MSEVQGWRIWSVEHDAWWRPGKAGYTTKITEAGVYTEAEAVAICDDAGFCRRTGMSHPDILRSKKCMFPVLP